MGKSYPGPLVFGLDIGTRSIVGTVGYKEGDRFTVVAQRVKEHETRSMLDGQIHDIKVVGKTIQSVKEELEKAVGQKLPEVCVAAAGRVLRTAQVHIEQEYEEEKEITPEDVIALSTAGIEKAYGGLNHDEDSNLKFYCVGFTMQRYFVNGNAILNPEQHKARVLEADMIATFLPDDVVDGLYKAVDNAGMSVANLTLEPIAAIQVAIPQSYRMLNIALIDVGAGTSDICITKDGVITAYGMIPIAGDSITEEVARQCLVDFDTAEVIKRGICSQETIEYKDIMGLPQKATRKEVLDAIHPAIQKMAVQAADKIKELNGDQPVSAVFVVGGGGKILGYTDLVAETLGIPKERCAVRGEDVLHKIDFTEKNAVKDSLMVTPVGICLSFYEQSNHFVFVTFDNERVKLYDNDHLTVMDAALQANYENEKLFPKRGRELSYYLNGKRKVVRGELGEPACFMVNGKPADLHTPIRKNDLITVTESTAGEPARMQLGKIADISSSIRVIVNDKTIELPAFAEVNGNIEADYYELQDEDRIEIIHYYTVSRIADFMDVRIDTDMNIYVNNKLADLDTKVYDNFSVIWTMEELQLSDVENFAVPDSYAKLVQSQDGESENDEVESDDIEKLQTTDAITKIVDAAVSMDEEAVKDMLQATKKDEIKVKNIDSSSTQKKATEDSESKKLSENVVSNETDASHLDESDRDDSNVVEESSVSEKQETEQAPVEQEMVEERPQENEMVMTEVVTDENMDLQDSEALLETENNDGQESDSVVESVKPEVTLSEEELAKKKKVEMMIAAVNGDTEALQEALKPTEPQIISVWVNQEIVTLEGKLEYVFVDVFDKIDFDLSKPKGRDIITNLNGRRAQFMEPIKTGDNIDIYWDN